MEKLLSTDELAEYLGIPKSTIYNWNAHATSALPRYKLGVQVRYRLSEVEAWLAEQKVGGVTHARF